MQLEFFKRVHAVLRAALASVLLAGMSVHAESSEESSAASNDDSRWVEVLGQTMFWTMTYGIMETYYNAHPEQAERDGFNAFPRIPGSFMAPDLRLDAAYFSPGRKLDAWEAALEAGRGPLALSLRNTWFDQPTLPNAEETETLTQAYAHLRMSYFGFISVDPGLGAMMLDGRGNQTAFAFTLPARIQIQEFAAFEIRSAWGNIRSNDFRDLETSVSVGLPHASLRLGYRWLDGENESVRGSFVGISLRW